MHSSRCAHIKGAGSRCASNRQQLVGKREVAPQGRAEGMEKMGIILIRLLQKSRGAQYLISKAAQACFEVLILSAP